MTLCSNQRHLKRVQCHICASVTRASVNSPMMTLANFMFLIATKMILHTDQFKYINRLFFIIFSVTLHILRLGITIGFQSRLQDKT